MSDIKFYIDTQGNDDKAYLEAIKKASDIADNDKDIKRVILLINTKSNTGWFERLFGSQSIKSLFVGSRINGFAPIYKLETKKTYKDSFSASDVVITCGWDSNEVFPIDDYRAAKYIIAIPWSEGALKEWVKTWNATELRGKVLEAHPEPSCIVKKALEELTNSVNMATALTHPSDIALGKTFVLALFKFEADLNENVVIAYLVSKLGWETVQAKQVGKLIATLNSGKFFQGGDRSVLKYHFNKWKEECK